MALTSLELLRELQRRGAVVTINDDGPRCEAPGGVLTDELRGAWRELKHELADIVIGHAGAFTDFTSDPDNASQSVSAIAQTAEKPHGPAMAAFLAAVQAKRVLSHWVKMDRELTRLWAAAEREAGHGLTLAGHYRPSKAPSPERHQSD